MKNLLDTTSVLDGVTVQGGKALIQGDSGNEEYVNGGGIYIVGGTVSLQNIELKNNSAAKGGGIYAKNANVTLKSIYAHDNQAYTSGGAIYLSSETRSYKALIENATITNNDSANGSIYVGGSPLSSTIRNSTIAANTTGIQNPNSIAVGGFHQFISPGGQPLILINVTLKDNQESNYYVRAGHPPILINTIAWNITGSGPGIVGNVTSYYSLIKGNNPAGNVAGPNGDINARANGADIGNPLNAKFDTIPTLFSPTYPLSGTSARGNGSPVWRFGDDYYVISPIGVSGTADFDFYKVTGTAGAADLPSDAVLITTKGANSDSRTIAEATTKRNTTPKPDLGAWWAAAAP